METDNIQSGGVLLSRFDCHIQYAAKNVLKELWKTDRVDLMTAEDPLHLFFHDVDQNELSRLCTHIETFLKRAEPQRLVLAAGTRPDVLTDEEVKQKLSGAVTHLARYFPSATVDGLFVDQQTHTVERVVSGAA